MGDETTRPAASPDGELAQIIGVVVAGFGEEPAEALSTVEQASLYLERLRQHPAYESMRAFLGASRHFFLALARVQSEADFAAAAGLLRSAGEVFQALEFDELTAAAEGLRLYFEGISEIGRQNLTRGMELLSRAPEALGRAGEVGARFRPLVDHMAPEQLFTAGVIALTRTDLALARALFEQAAQKAEHLADAYYEPTDEDWSFCHGLARLYRAYYAMFQHWSDFSRFDLERIMAPDRLAREAREWIGRTDLDNPIRRNCFRLAGVVGAISDVLVPAAHLLRALLEGQPTPELDYPALERSIQEAEDESAALGEQGVGLIRVCAQLRTMLANLRRYDQARPRARPVSDGRRPTRLFVMMPYSQEARLLEDALRHVFEDEPYCFELILARDRTLKPGLFDNVKAHMELVDGFLADISDLNPNVMLELGMTENDPRNRPVFVLRRHDGLEAPSDLKGRLYVEYTLPAPGAASPSEALAKQLRHAFESIEDTQELLARRRARYLSDRLIRGRIRRARLIMDDAEVDKLRKSFETVDELEQADAGLIARWTGFDPHLADALARVFRPAAREAAP